MDWEDVDSTGVRPPTPDIMNDPAFETNHGHKPGGVDEIDTCRICRGEGTPEEQLFYPCKCSGSIKFVHQNCLMEWLSHSQKKHCELCKTPFRFTKLYDPNMPSELPVPVFLKELFIHGCRALVTWLRFGLVAFVWLGLLPWSMRTIWRGLFWLADGRWPAPDTHHRPTSTVANKSVAWLAAHGTSPARPSPVWDVPSTSIATARVFDSNPQSQSIPSMLNFTTGEPLIYSIAKAFLSNAFFTPTPSGANQSTVATVRRIRQPSWLSDMNFLNNVTSSPTLNNIIIDTLEGQLITLLVVISFILVFLIREWVVQQQPVINLPEAEGEALGQLLNRAIERNAEEAREEEVEEEVVNAEAEAPAPDTVPRPEEPEQPYNEANTDLNDLDPAEARDFLNGNALPDSQTFNPFAPNYTGGYPENPPYPNTARGQEPPIFHGNFHNHNRPFQIPADASNRPSMWDEPAEADFTNHANSARNPLAQLNTNEDREDQESKADPGPSSAQDSAAGQENTPPFNFFSGQGIQWRFPDLDEERVSPVFQASVPGPPETVPATAPARNADFVPVSPLENHGLGTATTADSSVPNHHASGARAVGDDNGDDTPPGTAVSTQDVGDIPGDVDSEPERATVVETEPTPPNPVPTAAGTADNADEQLYTTVYPPTNIFNRIFNCFWGAIPIVLPDDDDADADADPQPALIRQHQRHRHGGGGDANEAQNRARQAAAANDAADGNDVEAVEDADDLEGVMELIGMHGPLFGLLQNAVFSALLISFTVSVGIWLPYLWGKIALVMLVNPVGLFIRVPITAISMLADITVDLILGCFAYVVYLMNVLVRAILAQLGVFLPSLRKLSAANSITFASLSLMEGSSQRLTGLLTTMFTFHESDLPMFSAVSHEALKLHQTRLAYLGNLIFSSTKALLYDIPLGIIQSEKPLSAVNHFVLVDLPKVPGMALAALKSLGGIFGLVDGLSDWSSSDTLIHNSNISSSYELSRWSSKDRLIAIILGYCFASLIGVAYLRISGIISGPRRDGQRGDGPVAEILRQAGGVMKVIIIIGIEMIVFPLYCGILLDIALLPLFGNGLFASRAAFTLESPLTSLFVHWFIGTCYMFHFALFVSMCRKIMRSGVLYFIRDPDDPTFHPVRDVLERNITTQLRKIAFSALVYGALVIICLGGVVWGLSLTFRGILPVYWSSNEPVLEFPVDLLFYNFVMPVAIRAIKPSDGLHKIYDWWFHRCARMLRLTHFLFGDRKPDEEGYTTYPSWRDAVAGFLTAEKPKHRRFLRDGRFVRAPASDQVRIPKGEQVFVEVNEDNERIDGKPDYDDGRHGKKNELYSPVYVPPNFRARIFAFLLLLWLFAAATGVGITIIPLVIGRRMLSFLFPPHIRVNDIYALSAGVYTIGTAYYGCLHFHKIISAIREGAEPYMRSPKQLFYKTCDVGLSALRMVYIAAAVGLFLPSVFALITEFYVLIPLHTYLSPSETHIIYFVQDWTLGILYVRMTVRFLLRKPLSLPAMALRGIVRNGWTNPDIWLATRVFFIPVALVVLVANLCPLPIGLILNATLFSESSATVHSQVYRYSYPAFLVLMLLAWGVHILRRQIGVWRVSIRDDVYMIGERLHNLGEKRARNVGSARRMITS